VPLSVLDLVPVSSGESEQQALANSLDLVRQTEGAGYLRYWFAEHHLNDGVIGSAPAVLIALAGAVSTRIRLGSGAVQLGHRNALSVAEEFGLLATAFPGRIDLGLGRSGGRPPAAPTEPRPASTTPEGLYIPAQFSAWGALAKSPRFAGIRELLLPDGAESADYAEQVGIILELLSGKYSADNGVSLSIAAGAGGVPPQVWILGSSGGISAEIAGRRGLPFAANYHVAPSNVLEAVDAYRAAFIPSAELEHPLVQVSADVVVGATDTAAAELASGYALWVRSIRAGEGAVPFPSPAEAADWAWTDADRALVADRVDTQFVGAPETVVAKLEALQSATDADELLITTVTHDHADRVRSYQILAQAWAGR
jgi:alkanesulfonate monooxygenase SsuD/methylene tetrahydromethanopterin reductase-like flavin-dependent oxidoreductase (luciferase family)